MSFWFNKKTFYLGVSIIVFGVLFLFYIDYKKVKRQLKDNLLSIGNVSNLTFEEYNDFDSIKYARKTLPENSTLFTPPLIAWDNISGKYVYKYPNDQKKQTSFVLQFEDSNISNLYFSGYTSVYKNNISQLQIFLNNKKTKKSIITQVGCFLEEQQIEILSFSLKPSPRITIKDYISGDFYTMVLSENNINSYPLTITFQEGDESPTIWNAEKEGDVLKTNSYLYTIQSIDSINKKIILNKRSLKNNTESSIMQLGEAHS